MSACPQCPGQLNSWNECDVHGRPPSAYLGDVSYPLPAGTGGVALMGDTALAFIMTRADPSGHQRQPPVQQRAYSPPERCLDGAEARALLASRGAPPLPD